MHYSGFHNSGMCPWCDKMSLVNWVAYKHQLLSLMEILEVYTQYMWKFDNFLKGICLYNHVDKQNII